MTTERQRIQDQMVIPSNSGASWVACSIINATFIEMDGFAAMREQLENGPGSYDVKAFAATLARVADRELAAYRKIVAQTAAKIVILLPAEPWQASDFLQVSEGSLDNRSQHNITWLAADLKISEQEIRDAVIEYCKKQVLVRGYGS